MTSQALTDTKALIAASKVVSGSVAVPLARMIFLIMSRFFFKDTLQLRRVEKTSFDLRTFRIQSHTEADMVASGPSITSSCKHEALIAVALVEDVVALPSNAPNCPIALRNHSRVVLHALAHSLEQLRMEWHMKEERERWREPPRPRAGGSGRRFLRA